MSELALGAHRLDDRLVPEQRPVGTVVAHQHAGGLAGAYCVGKPRAGFLVAVGALQNAQVVAEQRRRRIAAQLREGAVDEYHREIAGRGIADNDALGGVLDEVAPLLARPVVHSSLPASSFSSGAAAARASSSRALSHCGEASRAARAGPAAAPRRACREAQSRPHGCYRRAACRNLPTVPAGPGSRCLRRRRQRLPLTDHPQTLPPETSALRAARRESSAPTGWPGPDRPPRTAHGPP